MSTVNKDRCDDCNAVVELTQPRERGQIIQCEPCWRAIEYTPDPMGDN